MTKESDGGPAFPRGAAIIKTGAFTQFVTPAKGMSLRDWFAGQALRARWGDGAARTPEAAAAMAYQLADAMLAERERPS